MAWTTRPTCSCPAFSRQLHVGRATTLVLATEPDLDLSAEQALGAEAHARAGTADPGRGDTAAHRSCSN